MELVHKDTIKFENNNFNEIYECNIESFKDLVLLIKSLEDTYGVIEDILCIKTDKDNKLVSFIEYDDLDELKNNFNNDEYREYNMYKFSSRDRYIDFMYDINSNNLNIYNNEGSLGKKIYDENKVKYYKDNYGNIVKYDDNKRMIYTFDKKNNKWIKNRELTSDFLSYDSEYTLIDFNEPDEEELSRKHR